MIFTNLAQDVIYKFLYVDAVIFLVSFVASVAHPFMVIWNDWIEDEDDSCFVNIHVVLEVLFLITFLCSYFTLSIMYPFLEVEI